MSARHGAGRGRRWTGGALHPQGYQWDAAAPSAPLHLECERAVWAVPPKLALGLEREPRHGRELVSWALRDQNAEPICVAQAATAAVELLSLAAHPAAIAQRYSVRFLYSLMRSLGPGPSPPPDWARGFTRLDAAATILHDIGACPEAAWPEAGDLLATPNAHARDAAAPHRYRRSQYLCYASDADRQPGTAKLVLEELTAGRPVAIALPAFAPGGDPAVPNNWTTDAAIASGAVADPQTGDAAVPGSGHAVCIIGFLPQDGFVFRNSMGEDFATEPPPTTLSRGYGTISAAQVEANCWELLSLRPR